jgi:hypothetical protein
MGDRSGTARARAVRSLLDEPAHWLYAGVTMTGKTTLARMHARLLANAGHRVIVYDPVRTETAGGDWENCEIISDEPDIAVERLSKARDCFIFVDEAPDLFGHEFRHTHWMLRKKRHDGVYFRLISQRPTMLPPNVRTQCARYFIFRLALTDTKELLADVGHNSSVLKGTEFDTGDCLMVCSGSPEVEFFNVFDLVGKSHQPTERDSQ